jgi:hypothetical protein
MINGLLCKSFDRARRPNEKISARTKSVDQRISERNSQVFVLGVGCKQLEGQDSHGAFSGDTCGERPAHLKFPQEILQVEMQFSRGLIAGRWILFEHPLDNRFEP